MLLPLLLLLQTAQPPVRRPLPTGPVTPPAGTLVVRPATGADRSVLLFTERGELGTHDYARADQLAAALGGTLVEGDGGQWRLRLPGLVVELREGVAFAGAEQPGGRRELPLLDAPFVDGERLWVPVQLVSDLLPRLLADASFDGGRRLLVLARPEARERATVAARAAPTRPAPPEAPVPRVAKMAPVASPAEAPDSSVRLPTIIGPRRTPEPALALAERIDAAAGPGAGALADRVVVIDAGHGGPDTGMHGPIGGGAQVREKDITLGVALALRTALRSRGVGVAMTRTRDTLVALADRGRIANQRGGALFVSVHVNAANPGWRDPAGARGFETYFLSEAKTADDRQVADLENESVRFEAGGDGGASDPLGFILRDMEQNEHLRESSQLAALVQRRLGRVHPGPSRGVKQAGFRVLVSAFMPAVLVEIGFGSNPQEAAYLSSPRGQREIAEAVADAAVEYLRRRGARVRAGVGRQ